MVASTAFCGVFAIRELVVSCATDFVFVLLPSFVSSAFVCAVSVVCVLLLSMIPSSLVIVLFTLVFCANSIPRYRLAISHPISRRFSSYSNS